MLVLLNIISQIMVAIPLYFYYNNNNIYYCACKKLPISFPLAKTSANLIAINTGLSMISLIKYYRKYIYIPIKYKKIHYILVFNIYLWSTLHSIVHIINYNKLKINIIENNTGITGIILVIILILIIFGTLLKINKYNYFLLNHTILFYIYIIIFYIHQLFCFTKYLTKKKTCPILISYIITTPPLILYIIENIYKYTKYKIIDIEQINDTDIYKINIKLPKENVGKIVWLCCPKINIYEFHPFAVSLENTIYFKIRGDWTRELTKEKSQKVFVFGGIKIYSDNVLNDICKNKSVIIISGIGLTIFVDILERLSKSKLNLKNIDIIIIVKSYKDIEWITESYIFDILVLKNVNIQFYFTDTSIITDTLFRFNYKYNRPDLNKIINGIYLHINMLHFESKKINIYHAGNKSIYKDLKKITNKYKSIKLFTNNFI